MHCSTDIKHSRRVALPAIVGLLAFLCALGLATERSAAAPGEPVVLAPLATSSMIVEDPAGT